MIHKLKLGSPFVVVHTERWWRCSYYIRCALLNARRYIRPPPAPSPPINLKRWIGEGEILFNFHRGGESIIVVGHWDTVIYCRDPVISCHSRSRRALVTGTLFQVPSSFSVFLQLKLGKGVGGGVRSQFWMLIFSNRSWRGTRLPRTLKDLL